MSDLNFGDKNQLLCSGEKLILEFWDKNLVWFEFLFDCEMSFGENTENSVSSLKGLKKGSEFLTFGKLYSVEEVSSETIEKERCMAVQ